MVSNIIQEGQCISLIGLYPSYFTIQSKLSDIVSGMPSNIVSLLCNSTVYHGLHIYNRKISKEFKHQSHCLPNLFGHKKIHFCCFVSFTSQTLIMHFVILVQRPVILSVLVGYYHQLIATSFQSILDKESMLEKQGSEINRHTIFSAESFVFYTHLYSFSIIEV